MATRGLYKIENKVNGKVYIGESINIEQRWNTHLESLKANKHHSYKLQKDWNEFGKDNFIFEVLIRVENYKNVMIIKTLCLIKEEEFIIKYNSIENGYNIKPNNYEEAFKRRECGVTSKYLDVYKNKNKLGHYIEKDGFLVEELYDVKELAKCIGVGYYKFIDKLYEDGYLTLNKNKSIEFKLNDIVLTFKSITSLKLNRDTFNKLIDKYKLP